MLLGIAIAMASLIGIIYGVKNKNKALSIFSIVVLLLIIAVWVYFYNIPY